MIMCIGRTSGLNLEHVLIKDIHATRALHFFNFVTI
jgi:hypothetical protein